MVVYRQDTPKTVKVFIKEEEWYPCYSICRNKDEEGLTCLSDEIEMDEKEIKEIEDNLKQFRLFQARLEELFNIEGV